jgi:glutathione synthase/RimK-type ligase-like ATP-grasp enzyme
VAILIVVNDPRQWPFNHSGVEVIDARSYLTRPEFSDLRGVKLFNLCRSYRYQSIGYYVSLLAEARGHKPQPSVTTIQDLKSQAVVRLVSNELDDIIQHSLARIQSERFTLSVYFGRNLARRYERLSLELFNMFQSPLLRAQFVREKKWQLKSVSTIAASDIPESHRDFVAQVAAEHFSGRRRRVRRRSAPRYDLAILFNPQEQEPPSDVKALDRFIKAAESLAIGAELVGPDDYGRLAEYDGLFIRETTRVNHHTYRFSRRAAAEGLVVIDDPQSIVRCTNKVYLAELLARHKIEMPKTLLVHKGNMDQVAAELGLPCVLKQPDSAFSRGVVKAETPEQLTAELTRLLDESDLVVGQQFVPTTFDWRIGILDQRPFYACKYHMAAGHWQIVKRGASATDDSYGRVETLPVELAPRKAVSVALKAANLVGDGFYGVDVKQSGDRFYIVEVNDNPTIQAGIEDRILRDELYRRVMAVFLTRIEQRKAGAR